MGGMMGQRVMEAMLTAVFLAAALTQAFGVGHWTAGFAALDGEPWARYMTALVQLAAVVLFWWPGRRGYGAALMCATALGAVIAHLAVLGTSSAPPAVVMAVLSGMVLRQRRGDFQR
jgi:putative oxidoreductase